MTKKKKKKRGIIPSRSNFISFTRNIKTNTKSFLNKKRKEKVSLSTDDSSPDFGMITPPTIRVFCFSISVFVCWSSRTLSFQYEFFFFFGYSLIWSGFNRRRNQLELGKFRVSDSIKLLLLNGILLIEISCIFIFVGIFLWFSCHFSR